MTDLPTGTVTFLFADIEGSTRLLQSLGDRYTDVLAAYRQLLRAASTERGGLEINAPGDAIFAAFRSAREAVAAAVAAQCALGVHPWPDGVTVRARMGLHTGEPVRTGGDYVGLDVHRAARLCAAGHGGQILLSQTTHDLVERDLPEGVALKSLGLHRLRDLQRPEQIFQAVIPNLPAGFPPLRSLGILPNNLPV